jgi:hypothetical protein
MTTFNAKSLFGSWDVNKFCKIKNLKNKPLMTCTNWLFEKEMGTLLPHYKEFFWDFTIFKQ